jgi:hypothetical protein
MDAQPAGVRARRSGRTSAAQGATRHRRDARRAQGRLQLHAAGSPQSRNQNCPSRWGFGVPVRADVRFERCTAVGRLPAAETGGPADSLSGAPGIGDRSVRMRGPVRTGRLGYMFGGATRVSERWEGYGPHTFYLRLHRDTQGRGNHSRQRHPLCGVGRPAFQPDVHRTCCRTSWRCSSRMLVSRSGSRCRPS